MAAPLMIIKRVVRAGPELQIILRTAARDDDISCFLRLCFSIDSGDEQLILDCVRKRAAAEGTTKADLMNRIRTQKMFSLLLSVDTQEIKSLEFYSETNRNFSRKISVE